MYQHKLHQKKVNKFMSKNLGIKNIWDIKSGTSSKDFETFKNDVETNYANKNKINKFTENNEFHGGVEFIKKNSPNEIASYFFNAQTGKFLTAQSGAVIDVANQVVDKNYVDNKLKTNIVKSEGNVLWNSGTLLNETFNGKPVYQHYCEFSSSGEKNVINGGYIFDITIISKSDGVVINPER